MTSPQQLECVQTLGDLVKQMYDLDFPAYGSIYFNNGLFSSSESIPLGTCFCIGPNSSLRYFAYYPTDDRFYHRSGANRGPSHRLREDFSLLGLTIAWKGGLFMISPADCWMWAFPASPRRLPVPPTRPVFRGRTEEHLALLSKAEVALETLSRDPRVENIYSPLLLHPDLHKRNIS